MSPRADHLSYSVRVSDRARHARIQLSPEQGLVVVVPRRFDARRIAPLVESRRDWIARATRRLEDERARAGASGAGPRPDRIELRALGESWHLGYEAGLPGRIRLVERADPLAGEHRLVVRGATGTPQEAPSGKVAALLCRWLARRAQATLEPRLRELALARGVEIGPVSIRAPRARWASCSASGAMSLSRNLLFLPDELVGFVLVHELCHRVEMNHSRAFWRLVTEAEPKTAELRVEMRSAWAYVPPWAHAVR